VGGVAIALSMLIGSATAMALPTLVATRMRGDLGNLSALAGLGVCMMLVGLWDDLIRMTAAQKFGLQLVVGTLAWSVGIRIEGWQAGGIQFGMLSLPITLLWIVGITNAFNLIDGIDGLAAGASLFATMALLVVSIVTDQTSVATLLAALAGASAAFLRYNFNPASIFLGDSGSLFLGFMLSALALQSSQKSTAAFAIAVPIVSLGLPVVDTTVVIVRRIISRQSIFRGDRRHIHHVLLDRGLSPREAVMWLYAVCGILALISLLALRTSGFVGPVLVMLGLGVGIAIQQLRIPELRALNAHVIRGVQRQRRLLAGGVLVHTLLDDLANATVASEVLAVLAKSLEASGFVSAKMKVPIGLELHADMECGWRQEPELGDFSASGFQWSTGSGQDVPLVTLQLPLLRNHAAATLTLVARSDDAHHAAIIRWLGKDVNYVIGAHIERVAFPPLEGMPKDISRRWRIGETSGS